MRRVPSGYTSDLRNPRTTIAEGSNGPCDIWRRIAEGGFEPDSVPRVHDGESAFSLQVRFDESNSADDEADEDDQSETRTPPELTGLTLSEASFLITGGRIMEISRIEQEENHRWVVSVAPNSMANVSSALARPSNCADEGALCNGDGRRLANNIHVVIKGPPGLSVTDTQVAEGLDATMDFLVSLRPRAVRGSERRLCDL